MSQWDSTRRQNATNAGQVIFVLSMLLLVFVGIPLTLVGLIVGLAASFWWILWIGLAASALGLVGAFFAMAVGMGAAQAQAQDAAARYFDRDR